MFCANPKPGRFFSTRCRKCKPCLALRQEDWTSRTVWEVLAAEKAVFITLTFRRKPADGYAEFQRYAKRVRIALQRRHSPRSKMRFVCASEFGERYGRYHLHGVVVVHGANPGVHFFRNAWKGGFTHAREIKAGSARRTGRYVSKYLAKAGRIRASNGFGTSAETVQRVNYGTGIESIIEAFPGAQVVGVREEKGARTQRAPYALRKRFLRSAYVRPLEPISRPVGGLEAVQSGPVHDSHLWGDYLPLNSVRAYIAEAEYQLRLSEEASSDSETPEAYA